MLGMGMVVPRVDGVGEGVWAVAEGPVEVKRVASWAERERVAIVVRKNGVSYLRAWSELKLLLSAGKAVVVGMRLKVAKKFRRSDDVDSGRDRQG